jgi:hypothetical protein
MHPTNTTHAAVADQHFHTVLPFQEHPDIPCAQATCMSSSVAPPIASLIEAFRRCTAEVAPLLHCATLPPKHINNFVEYQVRVCGVHICALHPQRSCTEMQLALPHCVVGSHSYLVQSANNSKSGCRLSWFHLPGLLMHSRHPPQVQACAGARCRP